MLVTKKMSEEDVATPTFLDRAASRFVQDDDTHIRPDGDAFRLSPIRCNAEVIAIATFAKADVSSGGIFTPGEGPAEEGIVVGTPPDHDIKVGDVVKFNSKQKLCDLTGCYAAYGNVEIICIRPGSVYSFLEPVQWTWKD